MILEHVVLDVDPDRTEAYEAAFAQAEGIISAAAGCRSVRLERCLETPGRYLLLVEWERLEDHMEGFRGSEAFARWRALLHHFYDPAPVVEHFETVAERRG